MPRNGGAPPPPPPPSGGGGGGGRRRRRRNRGGGDGETTLDEFGLRPRRAIRRDARQMAIAAAPSKRSVSRQYRLGQERIAGFNRALIDMLEGVDPGRAYDTAIDQQRLMDDAAAARLAAAGVDAGAIAAQTGIRGAATSALVGQGAAARSFGARQPFVARAAGAAGIQTLENARQDALRARAEGIRQQAASLYPQLRSQSLAEATALAGIRQNEASLEESARQFDRGLEEERRQFEQGQRESARQFDRGLVFERNQQRRQFQYDLELARERTEAALKGGRGRRGRNHLRLTNWAKDYTTAELRDMRATAADTADDAIRRLGIGPGRVIDDLVARGIARPIALDTVWRLYSRLLDIPWGERNQRLHPNKYKAYQRMLVWLQQRYGARVDTSAVGSRRGGSG